VRRGELLTAELADRQHGVFRRDQAGNSGLSGRAIARLVERGAWIPVHAGVYRVAGAPLSWRGALLAACWAGGPRGVASHRSAARLFDLPGGRDALVEVTCPRWRRKRHEGFIVHETIALDRWDVRIVDGIPTTSPERTLLDLGSVVGFSVVEMAMDVALRRGLVTLSTLWAMLGRLGRQGRNGAGVLRAVLSRKDPKQRPPESPMETRLLQVLRRRGLPDPVPQFEVYDDHGMFIARVDAAYPQWKVAIEYESLEYHTGAEAVLRDSGRRNRLMSAQWSPVTATIEDIRTGGHLLAAAIRAISGVSNARNAGSK
jgi:hypothetical protein